MQIRYWFRLTAMELHGQPRLSQADCENYLGELGGENLSKDQGKTGVVSFELASKLVLSCLRSMHSNTKICDKVNVTRANGLAPGASAVRGYRRPEGRRAEPLRRIQSRREGDGSGICMSRASC